MKKRRSLMKRVKGFGAGRKNLLKVAKVADIRAGMHAYRDRRVKKRTFRRLWQIQINAGARLNGTSFSKFIGGLKKKQIGLNRKMLAMLAKDKPAVFKHIAEHIK